MVLRKWFEHFPFIAITRGIRPDEAKPCAEVLRDHGFCVIETPLNSPEPYRSIEKMVDLLGETALVGAGTVTDPGQVEEVKRAGGRLIVSPHCDVRVIERTKECGLFSLPGAATPTEMLTALRAGADAVKLFPAEIVGLAGFKAMRAVMPQGALMVPVGGIDSTNWQPFFQAGAAGFGLGSSLYRAGRPIEEVARRAELFYRAWQENGTS
jgi:2-dehydro-3-deoxyphosphogalactonate aldolase